MVNERACGFVCALACVAFAWGCGPVGEDGDGGGDGAGVACKLITDQSTCATTEGCRTVAGIEYNEEEECLEVGMYLYCVSDDSCEGTTGYSVRDSDSACFVTGSKCDAPTGWTPYAEGELEGCNLGTLMGASDCPR